jgi:hypothetical protein
VLFIEVICGSKQIFVVLLSDAWVDELVVVPLTVSEEYHSLPGLLEIHPLSGDLGNASDALNPKLRSRRAPGQSGDVNESCCGDNRNETDHGYIRSFRTRSRKIPGKSFSISAGACAEEYGTTGK